MTALPYTLSDSRVMLRRNLKHQLRYPSMTLMLVGTPIVLLLLFVYVFGGQLGAGLGAHLGRHAYLDYVVPGLLLITVASAVQGTSIMVAMDMTGGIIDRFRTMDIARGSVLTGHVFGSLIQTLAAIGVLIGVAFGLGFDASAGPLDWLAAIGILALFAFALIWLAVALRACRQERRDRQQHPDDPDPAALLRQRVRGHGDDAGRATPVRGVPALYARHRHRARTAHRRRRRAPRDRGDRLESGYRGRVLPVGASPLQPASSRRTTLSGRVVQRSTRSRTSWYWPAYQSSGSPSPRPIATTWPIAIV